MSVMIERKRQLSQEMTSKIFEVINLNRWRLTFKIKNMQRVRYGDDKTN